MEVIALDPQYKPKIVYRLVDPDGNYDDKFYSFGSAVSELRDCIYDAFYNAAIDADIKIYDQDGNYTEDFNCFSIEYAKEIAQENGWRLVEVIK